MKSQFFLDKHRLIGALFLLCIIITPFVCICIYSLPILVEYKFDFSNSKIAGFPFLCGMMFFCYGMMYLSLASRAFSVLSIRKNKIMWRCFPFKSVKLNVEDCLYVNIEDMAEHNKGYVPYRGDENSYIYLSSTPLAEKYKHKIDSARCQKGFIKFAYSDKLCLALMEWLPPEKRGNLRAFYNRMQEQDRQLQAQKAAKKRRKEKAKRAKRKEK